MISVNSIPTGDTNEQLLKTFPRVRSDSCHFHHIDIAAKAEMAYPEKCKADKIDMSNMDMSGGKMAMGDMTDYQKDAMDGMKAMDANMQQGMMKKGADVSFICGMIAHHMGAINMSQVELKYGKDEWSKKMAQSIIEAQEKEITEMTGWLEKQSK